MISFFGTISAIIVGQKNNNYYQNNSEEDKQSIARNFFGYYFFPGLFGGFLMFGFSDFFNQKLKLIGYQPPKNETHFKESILENPDEFD